MDPDEEELLLVWEREQRIENSHGPLSEFGYVTFVSRSAGKGRRRGKSSGKTWVEIELIRLPGGKVVSIIDGRLPKKHKARLDSIAEEAVGAICPPHVNHLEYFLGILRERFRRSTH